MARFATHEDLATLGRVEVALAGEHGQATPEQIEAVRAAVERWRNGKPV